MPKRMTTIEVHDAGGHAGDYRKTCPRCRAGHSGLQPNFFKSTIQAMTKEYLDRVTSLADIARSEYVLPYCAEHDVIFESRTNLFIGFTFFDPSARAHLVPVHMYAQPDGAKMLEVLSMGVLGCGRMANPVPLGNYVAPVTQEDTRLERVRLAKLMLKLKGVR